MRAKYLVYCLLATMCLLFPGTMYPQGVGINVDAPSQPLEVGGIIFASQQGFMFPDGSVQTRAANNYLSQDAGDERWIVIMEINGVLGSYSYGGDYDDDVKVVEMEWEVSKPSMTHSGGGSSEPEISAVRVTKNIDRSSVEMLGKMFSSAHITDIKFNFMREDTVIQAYRWYYRITIENVRISKILQHQSYIGSDNWAHLEDLYFLFETIKLEYDWEDNQNYEYTIIE